MRIIRSLKEMSQFSLKARAQNKRLGFVPTMGALHQGHLSLIRRARRENDYAVVSIFVNPAQFAPTEDFKKYPRNLGRDAALCRKTRVDVIFYPAAKDMYPQDYKTYVYVDELSKVLCGASRPEHFRAVATVVTKLFNIVQPDTAYFGQKDAQQAVIIKRLAQDLNLPVKIRVVPVVRDNDGLALSSRNVYLSKEERKGASVLYQSLRFAQGLIKSGTVSTSAITAKMRRLISKKKPCKIDYISIVGSENLAPIKQVRAGCLIALAVWVGRTRLIDNIVIKDA